VLSCADVILHCTCFLAFAKVVEMQHLVLFVSELALVSFRSDSSVLYSLICHCLGALASEHICFGSELKFNRIQLFQL